MCFSGAFVSLKISIKDTVDLPGPRVVPDSPYTSFRAEQGAGLTTAMPKRKKVADPREDEVAYALLGMTFCITVMLVTGLTQSILMQDTLSVEQSRIKHTEMLNSSFFRYGQREPCITDVLVHAVRASLHYHNTLAVYACTVSAVILLLHAFGKVCSMHSLCTSKPHGSAIPYCFGIRHHANMLHACVQMGTESAYGPSVGVLAQWSRRVPSIWKGDSSQISSCCRFTGRRPKGL